MRKQRYLSDEEELQIKQYHSKGKSISWISRKLRRTYKSISKRVHDASSAETSKPARGKRLTETDIVEMRRLNIGGLSVAEICGLRGWHPRTIRKYLLQPPPPICTETEETIRLAQSALETAQAETAQAVVIQLDASARNFVRTLAQLTSCKEAAVVSKIFQRGLVETREALQC